MYNRLKEWIIDTFYSIRGKCRYLQERLSRMFNLLPTIWNIYDFDYSSCLELEYKQLLRIKKCMENPGSWAYEGIENDIHKLDICIKLLKMVIDDDSGFYNDKTRKFNHYVNLKNRKRFIKTDIPEPILAVGVFKENYYLLKAWHLYNKLRTQYMQHWWV